MEGGPPMFRQDFTCPALLKSCVTLFSYGTITLCGSSFQTILITNDTSTGLIRFRSPLLTEYRLISFPSATEMFQFAEFASLRYVFTPVIIPQDWVSPFGHLRINVCSQLHEAFRSVPRPSSPLNAKASPECSFALDSFESFRHARESIIKKLSHTMRNPPHNNGDAQNKSRAVIVPLHDISQQFAKKMPKQLVCERRKVTTKKRDRAAFVIDSPK